MNNPATIQISAEISVSFPRDKIIPEQTTIPKIGTSGTNGVLNGLSAVGFLTRSTQMPAHTKTNANNVPKLVRSPAILPGTKPANNPTKIKRSAFDLKGVRNFG